MTADEGDRPDRSADAVRRAGRHGGWEVLRDFALELVADLGLQAVSCLLLVGVGSGLWWAWGRSHVLAVGAVVVLVLGLAAGVGAAARWRSGPWTVRRLVAGLLIVAVVLGLWFLFYGSTCGCVTG